ncbi:hypothetical protein C8A03DRAFT_36917 [Achaetomium macrosporum]|uniref:Uncharacterized protein n=1 Tax=Achaetomium macrosporum TaxID=79813 RepID=A0AAN7HBU0_9PEZI|nr:hypothetical protein C8A03DRAFT_36917 [Achaetomium macrosporum]
MDTPAAKLLTLTTLHSVLAAVLLLAVTLIGGAPNNHNQHLSTPPQDPDDDDGGGGLLATLLLAYTHAWCATLGFTWWYASQCAGVHDGRPRLWEAANGQPKELGPDGSRLLIIDKDMKPENIAIDDFGQPMLAKFDLSKDFRWASPRKFPRRRPSNTGADTLLGILFRDDNGATHGYYYELHFDQEDLLAFMATARRLKPALTQPARMETFLQLTEVNGSGYGTIALHPPGGDVPRRGFVHTRREGCGVREDDGGYLAPRAAASSFFPFSSSADRRVRLLQSSSSGAVGIILTIAVLDSVRLVTRGGSLF